MAGAVQMRWWQWDSDCMMSAMLETQWFLLTLYYVCRCCFYRVTEHVKPQIVTFVMLVEKNVQNTHSTFRIRWAIKKINIHAMGVFFFMIIKLWLKVSLQLKIIIERPCINDYNWVNVLLSSKWTHKHIPYQEEEED